MPPKADADRIGQAQAVIVNVGNVPAQRRAPVRRKAPAKKKAPSKKRASVKPKSMAVGPMKPLDIYRASVPYTIQVMAPQQPQPPPQRDSALDYIKMNHLLQQLNIERNMRLEDQIRIPVSQGAITPTEITGRLPAQPAQPAQPEQPETLAQKISRYAVSAGEVLGAIGDVAGAVEAGAGAVEAGAGAVGAVQGAAGAVQQARRSPSVSSAPGLFDIMPSMPTTAPISTQTETAMIAKPISTQTELTREQLEKEYRRMMGKNAPGKWNKKQLEEWYMGTLE